MNVKDAVRTWDDVQELYEQQCAASRDALSKYDKYTREWWSAKAEEEEREAWEVARALAAHDAIPVDVQIEPVPETVANPKDFCASCYTGDREATHTCRKR